MEINLKSLREHKQISQKQLCDDLKIKTVTYNSWEKGKNEPSCENLVKLADYYNVTLDYLFGREFKNDLGYLTKEQFEIISAFLELEDGKQKKVAGYISAIKDEEN